MTLAAIAGAFGAIGILVVLHGLVPPRPTLAARITSFDPDHADGDIESTDPAGWTEIALTILITVKGARLAEFQSDVLVAGETVADAATAKLRNSAAGAVLATCIAWMLAWISSPLGLLGIALVAASGGYKIFDFELQRKAEERRTEFERTLTAFVTLLASSIAGGGGLGTALDDAISMGNSWVFDHLRERLAEARLDNSSPWHALELLGRDLQVDPLTELAGQLTLASTSGSQVTETLIARSNAARAKELAELKSTAEANSAKLGVPVGLMLFGWLAFMGYPAITSLIGG